MQLMEIYLRGVTSKGVVARLLRRELGDWGQHTVRVASQHNDALRGALNIARLDWVCAAGIFRDRDVVVRLAARTSKTTFSRMDTKRMALWISGFFSAERLMHLA